MMKYLLPLFFFLSACGNGNLSPKSGSGAGASDGAGSEVATSVLSGAVSGGGSSNVASNFPASSRESHGNLLSFLHFISEAQAATWSCTSAGFTTSYTGPGAYSYAPLSCHVTYDSGAIVAATWAGGDWSYVYAANCGPST